MALFLFWGVSYWILLLFYQLYSERVNDSRGEGAIGVMMTNLTYISICFSLLLLDYSGVIRYLLFEHNDDKVTHTWYQLRSILNKAMWVKATGYIGKSSTSWKFLVLGAFQLCQWWNLFLDGSLGTVLHRLTLPASPAILSPDPWSLYLELLYRPCFGFWIPCDPAVLNFNWPTRFFHLVT